MSPATMAPPTTSVAGAAGGGPVSGDLVAQLQALVAQLEGLANAVGATGLLGSAPITGGGGLPPDPTQVDHAHGDPTQADPTQVDHAHGDPTQADPTQVDHAHGDPAQGDPAQHAAGGHGAHIIDRTTPENVKRAERIRDVTEKFFSDLTRKDVRFPPGGKTHGRLSDETLKKFRERFPNLPEPKSVVFTEKGNTPLGVVFNEKTTGDFDLGMGTQHEHGTSGFAMQHVWFTDDLTLAFTDRAKGKDIAKVVRQENAAEAAAAGGGKGKDKADDKPKDNAGDKPKAEDKGKADDKGKDKDKPKGKGK